ncbi:MAG: single-stranded DNA-binding protein [Microbacteriaceae bacterium]|nr:single-stranded DNA-binding protein [Microbacteriaceae bacterium]
MQNDLITMTGGVGTAPDYRITKNGRARTRFRLASDVRRRTPEGEWETVSTSWYTVTCWGALARNVHASIEKGHRVLVHGRLRIDEYTDEQGATRLTPEINADAIGPDLTFVTARVERRGRDERPAEPGADGERGPAAEGWAESAPEGVDPSTGELVERAGAEPLLVGAGAPAAGEPPF